ncbi:MAG: NADH-quinone oxidoreductase subunit NuoE [Nitrospinota bacterium]
MAFEFSEENRKELERLLGIFPVRRSALLPALQMAQEQNGHISREVMEYLAELFELSPMEVWATASFYGMLKTRPLGRHHFQVCTNLSCSLLGAGRILRHLEARLGVRPGETRADGFCSLECVECLGACGGAPVVQLNEDYREGVTPEKLDALLEGLEKAESARPAAARAAEPAAAPAKAEAAS